MKEILNRIKEGTLLDFIDILLQTDSIDHYDIVETLTFLPEEWVNGVSFKKNWPDIMFRIGQRYSHELTSEYAFDLVVKDLKIIWQQIFKNIVVKLYPLHPFHPILISLEPV